MKSFTLAVGINPAVLAPNRARRMHWAARAKIARSLRLAAWAAWHEAGRPTLSPPAEVSLAGYVRRLLDHDALLSAMKPCLDGIFQNAALRDDGPAFLRIGTISQVKIGAHERPHVIFTAREVPGP